METQNCAWGRAILSGDDCRDALQEAQAGGASSAVQIALTLEKQGQAILYTGSTAKELVCFIT